MATQPYLQNSTEQISLNDLLVALAEIRHIAVFQLPRLIAAKDGVGHRFS